ncbi:MAG: hypothetical protein J3K34DRAFT_438511, partial [Monoraphidium minutum]
MLHTRPSVWNDLRAATTGPLRPRDAPNDSAFASQAQRLGSPGLHRTMGGQRRGAPAGGGAGRAAAAHTLRLLLLVAAAAAATAQARCSMARCADCRWVPARPFTRGWPGRVKACYKAKRGYVPAPDRRSVPDCAAGFAAKKLKGKTCIQCEVGSRFSPRHKIGTKMCTTCPTNATVAQYRNTCDGKPGYIYDPDDDSVRACREDFFCINNREIKCPANTNTNGLTAQSTCRYVDAGYQWVGGKAVGCPINTAEPNNRLKEQATDCRNCTTGLSTGAQTAQLTCDFNAAGYEIIRSTLPNGTVVNTPSPCKVDFSNNVLTLITAVPPPTCSACVPGTNTNGLTTQPTCEWLSPGWGSTAAAQPKLCEADRFRVGNTPLVANVTCTNCPPGLGTNGTLGNTACGFIAAGYYNNNGTLAQCPAETYFPTGRAFNDTSPCNNCSDLNLSTNGNTGSVTCNFVPPGFFYNGATQRGQLCPVDTASLLIRNYVDDPAARNCSSCSEGSTTNGTLGNPFCAFILPGYSGYVGPSATVTRKCAQGSYAEDTRVINGGTGANSTNATCTLCDTGSTTAGEGSTNASACALVNAGFFYNGTSVLPCPANTAEPAPRNRSDAAPPCNACPDGTSTNGATAQAQCLWLLPGYEMRTVGATNGTAGTKTAFLCPAEEFRVGTVNFANVAAVPCVDCNPGFSTNGTRGNTACNFMAAGYRNVGAPNNPIQCASDDYFPTPRLLTNLDPCLSCTPLNLRSTTGQSFCNRAPAGIGYFAPAPGRGEACVANTATGQRDIPFSARNRDDPCDPCGTGLSTNGATQQAACNWVAPGFFLTSTSPLRAAGCGVGTYGEGARNTTDGLTCTSCPTGLTTTIAGTANTTGATTLADCNLVLPGFFFNSVANAPAPCPVNTSSNSTRLIAVATGCPPCPAGTSTRNQTGQTTCTATAAAAVQSIVAQQSAIPQQSAVPQAVRVDSLLAPWDPRPAPRAAPAALLQGGGAAPASLKQDAPAPEQQAPPPPPPP